jgi:Lhr-like helicase
MNLLTACRETARRTFRNSLRPQQESAMLAVLNGRDALVSLPTGFGKSLIYQVPAMIVERPTIVISPLIARMTDQERALRKRGVPVVALHSRLRAAERRAALERLKKGGRLVVLTTPETLESAATAPLFERARPALLCIDEAHCISERGHDFRPSYLRLGNARKRLGNPPVLALTATATPRVREDIAERLRLDNPRVLVAPAHRENLVLTVDIVPGAAKFPGVPARICEVLLSDLEEAGSVERDQDGSVAIVVPPETFKTGAYQNVAALTQHFIRGLAISENVRSSAERRERLVSVWTEAMLLMLERGSEKRMRRRGRAT